VPPAYTKTGRRKGLRVTFLCHWQRGWRALASAGVLLPEERSVAAAAAAGSWLVHTSRASRIQSCRQSLFASSIEHCAQVHAQAAALGRGLRVGFLAGAREIPLLGNASKLGWQVAF